MRVSKKKGLSILKLGEVAHTVEGYPFKEATTRLIHFYIGLEALFMKPSELN